MKYIEEIFTGTVDTTGEVLIPTTINGSGNAVPESIHVVKVGTSENERIGKQIVIRKILFQGYLTFPASTTDSNICRLTLVQDTQVNGSLPAFLDVYDSSSINSFLNLDNSRRFKILKSKAIIMNRMTAGPINFGTVIHPFKFFLKCNIPIEWQGSDNTGTIGNLRSNGIFLMGVASTGDDTVQYAFHTRVRYTDN